MSALAKSTIFPAQLESEIFSKVKGHSSLAKVSAQEAIPFVGKDIFTFNFASDLAIVGENAEKPAGDATVTPVQIRPIKVVYQMRTSDEFMYASDEYKLNILSAFADGFAKKLGSGLDKMALHAINPASTSAKSTIISTNNYDDVVTQTVNYVANSADTNIDSAVAMVAGNEYVANGCIISPTMQSAISALSANGARKYPDFAFGATPAKLGNMVLDTNATVSATYTGATDTDHAIVGDFQNAFRWGIAKELPLETIEYGDPDNTGVDLKGSNQICLRSEAYIGWAILDANAFARVKA